MTECVDDVYADVLHYYGQDIWEMEGAKAMKLATRVLDIVEVNPHLDPMQFRSSIHRAWSARQDQVDEQNVVDLTELQSLDRDFNGTAVEIVRVVA